MSLAAERWRGMRVLVVEDEYFLAEDLATRFQSAGAEVIGPAGNVADAIKLVENFEVDGAVLDINLRGRRVYPVADLLQQKHIAFVFASGYGTELEMSGYDVPHCIKPIDFDSLEKALADQIHAKKWQYR
jgi:DNA-binding LytR/AlgR family response regulator